MNKIELDTTCFDLSVALDVALDQLYNDVGYWPVAEAAYKALEKTNKWTLDRVMKRNGFIRDQLSRTWEFRKTN